MKRIGCDTKVLEAARPTRAGHWRKQRGGRAQSLGSSPEQGNLGMRLVLFFALAIIFWVHGPNSRGPRLIHIPHSFFRSHPVEGCEVAQS